MRLRSPLLCGSALLHAQPLSAGAYLGVAPGERLRGCRAARQRRAYRDLTVADGTLMQMLSPILTAVCALFFSEQLSG